MSRTRRPMSKQEARLSRTRRMISHAQLHRIRFVLLRDRAWETLRALNRARESWRAGYGSASDNDLAAQERELSALLVELRGLVAWGRVIDQLIDETGRGPGLLASSQAASGGGPL